MLNNHAGGAGAGLLLLSLLLLSTTKIVAGLYIQAPPTASLAGTMAAINLAASVLAHPLSQRRLAK
jgi:hypothetical protein